MGAVKGGDDNLLKVWNFSQQETGGSLAKSKYSVEK